MGYGHRVVLDKVDLSLDRGDYLGVVGPNGAGKSTLLLGMVGVLQPISGSIQLEPDLRVGYVPQRSALDEVFPLTVRDVLNMGARSFLSKSARETAIGAALEQVDLQHLESRWYRELSGGQKQRVLLARALVSRPDLLILDEPTNGLDFPTESAIMALVDSLHHRGLTVVLVTHQLNLVANHAGSLALVGDGRVVAGSRDEILTGDRLATVYGRGLRVFENGSYRVVLPRELVST